MEITFYISKKANQSFFVQNLTEWHFSCRERFNKEWLEKTGPLNNEEKKVLKALKNLLKKYDFYNLKNYNFNIVEYFTRFDEINDKNVLDKKEIDVYLSAMAVFEKRFEKIWANESTKLQNVKKFLTVAFEKEQNDILNDLKILFKDKINTNPDFVVYLFLSTGPGGGGGGANVGSGRVTLECSSLEENLVNHKISTLWHEITHDLLRSYIEEYKKEFIKQNKIVGLKKAIKTCEFNYVGELVVHSLFTDMSVLTEKYFPTSVSTKLCEAVKEDDKEWLTNAYYVFPMLLIYYNGQSIVKKINERNYISPKEMAKIFCTNCEAVDRYFLKHNKKVSWFK